MNYPSIDTGALDDYIATTPKDRLHRSLELLSSLLANTSQRPLKPWTEKVSQQLEKAKSLTTDHSDSPLTLILETIQLDIKRAQQDDSEHEIQEILFGNIAELANQSPNSTSSPVIQEWEKLREQRATTFKPIHTSPKTLVVEKERSTREDILHYINEKEIEQALFIAKSDPQHFLSQKQPHSQEPLFYGTALGQRILLITSEAVKKQHDSSASDILALLRKSMRDDNQKVNFRQVSNFWLYDSEYKTGLAGLQRCLSENTHSDNIDRSPLKPTTRHNRKTPTKPSTRKHSWVELNANSPTPTEQARMQFRDDFIASQMEMGKWGTNFTHHAQKKESGQNKVRTLLTRRTCKWMLHVASFNNQTVHYSLDGLNLAVIARNEAIQVAGRKAKVPICTSEIRELFRKWDLFKNNVIFYKKLQICDTPWGPSQSDEIKAAWATYALELAQKHCFHESVDIIETKNTHEMLSSFHKQDYDKVISLFHSCEPSKRDQAVPPSPISHHKKTLFSINETVAESAISAAKSINQLLKLR